MATDDTNPQNAKRVGGRETPRNPDRQAGQASQDAGNPKGQKTAQQQGAKGTSDQGGTPMRAGLDQKGGSMPQDRGWGHGSRQLRQGNTETEEEEG
jgi:hypothetical protein